MQTRKKIKHLIITSTHACKHTKHASMQARQARKHTSTSSTQVRAFYLGQDFLY